MPFRLGLDRPRYNPDDYNSGERVRRGIGQAIDEYTKRKQEDQDWENEMAMNGGEVTPGESGVDRFKRVGGNVVGAIRRKLPGYDPRPGAEANMAAHPIPRVSTTPTADEADSSVALHSYTTPTVEGDLGTEDRPTGRVRMGDRRTDTVSMGGQPNIGSAIGDDLDEPEERTIVKGPHGQTAIMPTRRGQQQTTQRAERADWLWKEREQQRGRVELEKSKYHADEGQKQKDRMALVERRGQIQQRLRDKGLTEYQRKNLEMRQQALDEALDRGAASADASLSGIDEPDEYERRLGGRDPARAAQIMADDRTRSAARKRQEKRATAGQKTYSADPEKAAAQRWWDDHPGIQSKRARPK